MTGILVTFEWDGEHMVPLPRYARVCDQQYVVGERYVLEAFEQRSHASHSHYFAAIKEAWDNLPDALSKRFPSPEHLRKWALCRTGYADQRTIVARNPEEARKIGAIVRALNQFAVITITASDDGEVSVADDGRIEWFKRALATAPQLDFVKTAGTWALDEITSLRTEVARLQTESSRQATVITIYTPQSQNTRKMNKQKFQESKDRVLGVIAELLDVKKQDLERWGGKSA